MVACPYAAAETLLSGDKGKRYMLTPRQCMDKLCKLIEKVIKNATTEKEIQQHLAVAFMIHNLNPSLKTYVDLKGDFSGKELLSALDEWEATQLVGSKCFKTQANAYNSDTQVNGKPTFVKESVSCFYCGKLGHISKECRSRIAKEKSQPLHSQPVIKQETPEPMTGSNIKHARKGITCFSCHQKGHKSPQWLQKQTHIKRIQIPSNIVIPLRDNELFGSVGVHRLPITCDSGADISVVHEECVSPEQLTGETCEIDSFNRKRTSGKV